MKNIFIILLLVLFLAGCSTVTSTVEGVFHGVKKDASDVVHYTTCIFTDEQCFE